MIPFIFSFEIINIVVSEPRIFLWIPGSAFNNGPRSLPRNSPDRTLLYVFVFDNFTWAGELFAKPYKYVKLINQWVTIYEEN